MATTLPIPSSLLHFSIGFDVYNKTLTFTDAVQAYGAYGGAKGMLSLVDPDGIIFYQNAGWAANDFTTPDTISTTPTWSKVLAGVNYPVDSNGNVKLGNYTINYKVLGIASNVTTLATHRAKLDYARPQVAVLMEDHVLSSTLVVTDNTNYNVLHNAMPVIPTTTRLMTVKSPIDPVTGSPVAVDVTTSSKTITIGPDIFTEMYTTLLSTTALYSLELWDTAPFLIVHDTIAGDAYLKIKADTCFCTYYDCVAAVQLQMDGVIGSDPVEYNKLRKAKDKLNDYILLWIQAVSCGQDASRWCTAIKDVLLQTVPCDCAEEEGVPIEIFPIIGGGGGGGTITPSTFRFTFGLGSAGFPGSPHQYDVHEFTDTSGSYTKGDVYQYNGTSWVFQLNTMGSKGDTGHSVNSTSANVLHNGLTPVATSAGPTVQTLMSYVFPPNTLVNNGDQAKLKAIFQYAKNDNGKACFLSWNAGVVASHYTDSTITDATKFVELAAEVNMINAISQLIIGGAKRSGGFINDPVVTNASADLSAAVNILASGQEDASVGGDITCKQLYVELHSQLTGNVVGASYFAQGVDAITGGSTLHIVFASAFGSADYTTGINAYDSSHQPIAWTMSNKTVNGFDIDSLDSGTIEWSAILS